MALKVLIRFVNFTFVSDNSFSLGNLLIFSLSDNIATAHKTINDAFEDVIVDFLLAKPRKKVLGIKVHGKTSDLIFSEKKNPVIQSIQKYKVR